MAENASFLPGLSPVSGKPVHLAFDGGRLTSDAGVLVLAEVERRLGIAERLAGCIADPRAPDERRRRAASFNVARLRGMKLAGADRAADATHASTEPACAG